MCVKFAEHFHDSWASRKVRLYFFSFFYIFLDKFWQFGAFESMAKLAGLCVKCKAIINEATMSRKEPRVVRLDDGE